MNERILKILVSLGSFAVEFLLKTGDLETFQDALNTQNLLSF